MYTTLTATREFALKAAAAADRAIERHACCKSQFKFKCFSCGEFINRGDKITHCNRAPTGMTLRYRGADSQNGLTREEITFYQATTGENMWVHIGCIPCYWDSLPPTSNEYSRPKLRPICTDWGVKVYGEYEEWCGIQGCDEEVLPHFRLMKGYPEEKFMRDRIVHAVKRFQALWRGYRYKKAYPVARLEAIATQVINEAARATLSTRQQSYQGHITSYEADILRENRLFSGEVGVSLEVSDLITKRQREAKVYGNNFYRKNKEREGSTTAILFDRGKKSEAIYSCEIVKIAGEANGVHVYVRFHHDHERRKYHWRKFRRLERECHDFMTKMDIILVAFEGKISTHYRRRHCRYIN